MNLTYITVSIVSNELFFFSLFSLFSLFFKNNTQVQNTFVTLLFSVFSEFEYVDDITNANRFLGPLVLLVFFAFVDLILVSMLIAVVEEAFSRAQEDLRTNRENDKLLLSFQGK